MQGAGLGPKDREARPGNWGGAGPGEVMAEVGPGLCASGCTWMSGWDWGGAVARTRDQINRLEHWGINAGGALEVSTAECFGGGPALQLLSGQPSFPVLPSQETSSPSWAKRMSRAGAAGGWTVGSWASTLPTTWRSSSRPSGSRPSPSHHHPPFPLVSLPLP